MAMNTNPQIGRFSDVDATSEANPEHYDERGRPKKRRTGAPRRIESRSYQETLRRRATRERKLAAHRKSLHGRMVHQIVRVGHTIITEQLSYRGW